MTLYLGILITTLLVLLAGLLLTVGWWLYEFRQSYQKMPLLGEELTRQLMAAREALNTLQHTAKQTGPELTEAITEARNIMQDLQFLTQKGDEVAAKLDNQRTYTQRELVKVNPDGGQVMAENVVAAASAALDPLEELLAGLGESVDQARQVTLPLVNKHGPTTNTTLSRPVSQAEQALREKMAT